MVKKTQVGHLNEGSPRGGDEDQLLAWMEKRNGTTWSPYGGYTVQWAPAGSRGYQGMGLPAVSIYGESANPKARYINQLADQMSRQQGVGNNNDYFRLVKLITEIMEDPNNLGPNGELNQYGWALLAQQQIAGPGSHLDARKKEAAGEIFNTGLQLAMLPSIVGGAVAAPATTAGGLIGGLGGATVGAAIGDRFDDPYSGNHYGREIGGILGGLGGGFLGGSYGSLWESPITRTTPTSSQMRYAFPTENENHTITMTPKEKPFYYGSDGYFKANPNYNFRNGWGLIDDAVETGVIRVPQAPYKQATFQKYPFLKPSNSFSTMNMDLKAPFFQRGESMWPFRVKIQAPDLIAIPHNSPGVTWPILGKFGNISTGEAKLGQGTTPIINGQGNQFPTSKALLYRLDPTTNMYHSYDPKTITFGEAAGLDQGGLGIWAKYPHRYLDGGISTGDSYYINTPKSQWDPNHKFSLGVFQKGGNINKYQGGDVIQKAYSQKEVEDLIRSKRPVKNYTPVEFAPWQPLFRETTKAAMDDYRNAALRNMYADKDAVLPLDEKLKLINNNIQQLYDLKMSDIRKQMRQRALLNSINIKNNRK